MNNLTAHGHKGYRAEVDLLTPATVTNGKKIARFELSYFKGMRAQGIHVWLRAMEIEQHEGYHIETFELYGGMNVASYLKLFPRKNMKAVDVAAEKIDSLVPGIMKAFVDADTVRVKEILEQMKEVLA